MRKEREASFWAFDTEDDSKGNVYWVNFFNGHEHVSFDKHTDAIGWLLDQRGHFWAVNLEYDLVNVFNALLDQICVLTYGGFGLLKASLYGKPVHFFNTLRHWPLSVEEMGERLGHPKMPFDPTNLAYCQRDTEITWRFIHSMMEKYRELGIEDVRATLPSTTLKFFTTKFCAAFYERHKSLDVWDRLARSRYGGRCEVFHTHAVEGPVHEYDIVSSYPAVMVSKRFPNLETIRTSVNDPDWTKEGVACCTVKSPDREFPLLPWREPDTGKLLFPVGELTGTWTYVELRRAFELGYTVVSLHDAIEYDSMATPFESFMSFMFGKRALVKDSDLLMSYVLKIGMNSLFGKFGEEGELQVISRGKRYTMNQIPRHSNMIWASYILAYGRLALYAYIEQAAKKGSVLYCDTDSVFVRCKHRPFGEETKELGSLAFKGTSFYAHFKLPKLYRLDHRYKAKGVPLDKQTPHDMERLKREFFYDGVAEFMKPFRFMEARKVKEIPNVWRDCTKQLNAEYDKRVMIGGGRTWPVRVARGVVCHTKEG
ncbi:MAG: DNA polymerase [Cetobacterium sp.]